MFAKVYTIAFLASLVAALQIDPLRNAHSQENVRVTWINEAADTSRFAAFSVFLHHPSFRSDFAILNNQRPNDGGVNVTLPVVPAQDGYTLRATDVGNINNEFAVSSSFAIGPEVSSTSTIASSTSSSASVSGSGTNTASVSLNSGSGTILSVPPTSAFGVTVTSPTASSPTRSVSGSGSSGSGTGTGTAAQGAATNFNGATSASVEMKAWALGAAVMGLGWVVGGY